MQAHSDVCVNYLAIELLNQNIVKAIFVEWLLANGIRLVEGGDGSP